MEEIHLSGKGGRVEARLRNGLFLHFWATISSPGGWSAMASQLAWTSIAKALAHLHQQADLLPATGEVRESSRVATMHPRGWCATEWATRISLCGNCRDGKHF